MNAELLQKAPLLASLSPEDLDWLATLSINVVVQAGETLIREGDEGDSAYLILDGELEVSKRSGDRDVMLSVRRSGEVIGEMALLTQAPRMATVRALQETHLCKIPAEAFEQLLRTHPSATLVILRTVTTRLKNTEALLHQREKMASLGTMAAGLAHELNNPAAAAQRSVAQLQEALVNWQKLNFSLQQSASDERTSLLIDQLHAELLRRSAVPASLDPLARLDQEQSLQEWLEERGMDDAWQLTQPLVLAGWSSDELNSFTGSIPSEQFIQLIRWLAAGCLVYSLLDEVHQSTSRISEIVKGVKNYTYLDQAPIQEVDVHEGLENTLLILRHKLKTGVNVIRQYAQNLPHIEAYASELNQVWTNIIDNGIDAMQGQGELILRTYAKNDHVVVEIQDSGPGIPPDIQPRIFDPFFTTKPPGSGTGLGLNIAYGIVVNKHCGEIHLSSKPGATCFQVILPVRLGKDKQ